MNAQGQDKGTLVRGRDDEMTAECTRKLGPRQQPSRPRAQRFRTACLPPTLIPQRTSAWARSPTAPPLLAPVPLPPEGWRRAFGSQVRCLFLALASHASSCLPSVSSCRLKQSPEQEGDRAAPCAARPPREEAWEGARPQGEGQVTRAARFY